MLHWCHYLGAFLSHAWGGFLCWAPLSQRTWGTNTERSGFDMCVWVTFLCVMPSLCCCVSQFCFPPGQHHCRSTGRLIVFSLFGPFNKVRVCGGRGCCVTNMVFFCDVWCPTVCMDTLRRTNTPRPEPRIGTTSSMSSREPSNSSGCSACSLASISATHLGRSRPTTPLLPAVRRKGSGRAAAARRGWEAMGAYRGTAGERCCRNRPKKKKKNPGDTSLSITAGGRVGRADMTP